MADLNENFHKGSVLMMQAIQKYNDGDFEGGDHDRKIANDFFDKGMNEISSDDGKTSMLYGENRNFGIIMHVIKECVKPKMLSSAKGRSTLRDIMKEIRENRILRNESKVYDALIYPKTSRNYPEYVDTALSLLEGVSAKELARNNERVIGVIRKHGLNEMVDIEDEDFNLYENIEKAILQRGSLKDVDSFVAARNALVEHAENYGAATKSTVTESLSNLNDDEMRLIESIEESEDGGKELFENSKREALDAIREMGEKAKEGTRETLRSIYENVDKMTFNAENAIVDIAEMQDIINTIYGEC